MKIQKSLQIILFYAFCTLFFTNCSSYGPATIGNPPAHITRPWYEGETASSINICGRATTGNTYDINEKNRFGEGSLSYSRVFDGGHLAFNTGGYLGSYYTKNSTNTPFRYSGSTVRGEVGFRVPPRRHLFDRRVISSPSSESSFGFSYAWTTEYGDYYRLREVPRDTSLKRLYQSSHHLHSFVMFREFREQLNETDMVGLRTQFGLGVESTELSNLQMNVTLHYTHKMLTVYGQFGASFDGRINRIVPTIGLGVNYCLWIK